jgi:aspartyl-tRNA(Asn)/glutamyl-tRNA(Gln) amidotransferase subunit B
VEDHEVFRLRSTLGELPWERRYRLSEVFGLPDEYLDQLGREREVSDYFLRVVEGLGEGPEMPARARRAARWMVGEWSREMARYEGGAEACPVDASSLAAWLLEVERRPAPHALQTAFLEAMFREGLAATQWAGFARSYRVGAEELRSVVLRVLEVHPEQRRRYRGGKSGLLDFFVGQVLRESPEGSDPVLVRELCEKELGA